MYPFIKGSGKGLGVEGAAVEGCFSYEGFWEGLDKGSIRAVEQLSTGSTRVAL